VVYEARHEWPGRRTGWFLCASTSVKAGVWEVVGAMCVSVGECFVDERRDCFIGELEFGRQ